MKKAKKKKLAVSDPAIELEDAKEALSIMKENLRAATKELRKRGLMVQTTICDSHGKPVVVERINPAMKTQGESMRAISSLKRQISALEEEAEEKGKPRSKTMSLKNLNNLQTTRMPYSRKLLLKHGLIAKTADALEVMKAMQSLAKDRVIAKSRLKMTIAETLDQLSSEALQRLRKRTGVA